MKPNMSPNEAQLLVSTEMPDFTTFVFKVETGYQFSAQQGAVSVGCLSKELTADTVAWAITMMKLRLTKNISWPGFSSPRL